MENKEIEIQVRIEQVEPLKKFLAEKGRFISRKHQKDRYFSPYHRDFLSVRPIKEWLRLRDEGGMFSLNYKNWHFGVDGKSWHCDEYETAIEDIEKTAMIFKVLNFKPVVVVDKSRENYVFEDYKISLDEISGLGSFVEIEYGGKEDVDPQEMAYKMIAFLKSIGCGKIERNNGGYPFMLLFPEEAEFEEL